MDIDDLINNLGRRQRVEEKPSLKLKRAWIAERTCPEILPFAATDVESVCVDIKQLIAYIDEHSYEIENSSDRDVKINLLIVETELERMKYLIRAYLRARIAKIDQLIVWYSNPNNQQNLSPGEADYAQKHFQLQFNLYNSSFLSSWPEEYHDVQSQNNEGLVDPPQLDKPVVVKVIKDTYIGSDPAQAGEIWMTNYDAIREYVGSDMELI